VIADTAIRRYGENKSFRRRAPPTLASDYYRSRLHETERERDRGREIEIERERGGGRVSDEQRIYITITNENAFVFVIASQIAG
jgi:hypothetical protein